MKVIDKRTERNNDWNVGDVICYYKHVSDDFLMDWFDADAHNLKNAKLVIE